MSIRRITQIVCDDCGRSEDVQAATGWRRDDDRDLCPSCASRRGSTVYVHRCRPSDPTPRYTPWKTNDCREDV